MSTKTPKKMSPQQVAKIKELSHQGNSSYKIAKLLGIPPGVARYHIQREKLAKVQPQSTPSPAQFTSNEERLRQSNRVLLELLTNFLT